MAKKFNTPKEATICMSSMTPNKFTQDSITRAIKYLRVLGVPVYSDTTKYDPEYPRLLWVDGKVTQSCSLNNSTHGSKVEVVSVDEFVALFAPIESIEVSGISESYNAVVHPDHIKVGCQTISAEKFKELVTAAKEVGLIDAL
jgi:hypothetical protein